MSLLNTQSFKAATVAAAATRATAGADSNILGATGLPRAVLAAMFRRDGLFGRDSALSYSEQAVLQSRLPRITGLKPLVAPAVLNARLQALAAYTDALVEGRDAGAERSRLVREGLKASAIDEVAIVVANVRVVFGAFSIAVPALTVAPSAASAYARAA